MRVVSLLPAATEIIGALGALENLVGVTHECDFPDVVCSRARVTSEIERGAGRADVARQVFETGEIIRFDLRLMAALRPDLILTESPGMMNASEVDVRSMADQLPSQPRVLGLGASSVDGMFDDLRAVALALGAPDECEELCDGLRARLRRVHDTLKAAAAPRPCVAIVPWFGPVWHAGWMSDMVRRAGGSPIERHETRSVAELTTENPEAVVFAARSGGLARSVVDAERARAGSSGSWLNERAIWAMDGALIHRAGPRLIDGVEVLARIFNGALFSPLAAEHAVRVQ